MTKSELIEYMIINSELLKESVSDVIDYHNKAGGMNHTMYGDLYRDNYNTTIERRIINFIAKDKALSYDAIKEALEDIPMSTIEEILK
jgi:hypothetical protein